MGRGFLHKVKLMPSFAGVLYPNAFQMTNLIHSMSPTFLKNPRSQPFRFFRYKSIEMGSWNVSMSSNPKKSIWAMICGDLLNAEELREELKTEGHILQTKEPAEILVLGYERWGSAALFEKLNGPFAVALFDEQKEELYLGLDRMGQRTIYWSFQGDHFLFGTEIKGLLASGIVPQVPSNTSFSSYLYFGFFPQDYSAIEGINKLVPGHFLKINLRREMIIEQYWSLSSQLRQREELSFEEAHQRLGKVLESSINRACRSESKVATYLHNTLGSDLLSWLIAHSKQRDQVETFTPIFEEKEPTILRKAGQFAHALNLEHHSKRISVDLALDELPRIVWHLDEPVADPAILQTWHLGRLVQKSDSTLLLDLGWRDLMAGHDYYFARMSDFPIETSIAHRLAQLNPFLRDHLIFPWVHLFNPKLAFRILRNIRINREQIAYLAFRALFKGKTRKQASPFLYDYFDPEVFTQRFHRLTSSLGDVHPAMYYDLKTALPNHILHQYHRLLSSFGVKSYTPFLDNEMLHFAASLPDKVKFAGKVPAAVMVGLWKRLTGKDLEERSEPLIASTWSNHPRLRAVFSSLESGRLVEEGLVSQQWIHEMCRMQDLTDIGFRELWSVLILEIWFRLFINRPIGMTDHEVKTEVLLSQ